MTHSVAEATVKKVAFVAGCISLAVGVGMSFAYGSAMSYLHAISLSLLAVAAPIAVVGADMMRARGRNVMAGIMTAAGVACLIGEYTTHFGYTVGSRATDTQQTMAMNVSYKALQDNREAEKANLDIWRKQLAELTAANAWAATVKADGLRSQIESHDKAIELETAKGGCKTKCLQLMKAKGDLENRIGIAEQQADLTKRIEATQRLLDKKVETAAATPYKSSKIINQSIGFAQISTGEIEPSAAAIGWVQIFLGALIAAFTTYTATLFFQVAFPDVFKGATADLAKREDTAQTPAAPIAHQAIANPAPALLQPVQTYQQPAPQTFRIEDGRDIGAFLRDLNAALIAPAGKTA